MSHVGARFVHIDIDRLTRADSFKVGMIIFGVMFLLLAVLAVVAWLFMRKGGTEKEEFPAVLPQSDSGSVRARMQAMIEHRCPHQFTSVDPFHASDPK